MSNQIIFVGGIHGAGKTTVARLIAKSISGSHVTAGSLIQGATNRSGGKTVENVRGNQDLLLQELDRYRQNVSGLIVLDGHFSLITTGDTIVPIPLAVYQAIKPIALLLIESALEVIHSRLQLRDGAAPSLATIRSLNQHERGQAEAVSVALQIPLLILRGDVAPDAASENAVSQLRPIIRDGGL